MDVFKRALENTRRMWGNLTATQRVILAASAAAMVLLLVWGSVGATGTTWVRVVGSEVDEAARANVLKKFATGQRYELRNREIWVPKEDADRVVLELAGEGVISDDAVWKFLEQDSIIASKWDKEKRFQIALQRRLEGMIRRIEGVKNAAVVINPGSTTAQFGFSSGQRPSASVQVELRDGTALSRGNVQGIAGLVAKAAPGIELDQVHIMDTRGNPYRVPSAQNLVAFELFEQARMIEQDLQQRIKAINPLALIMVRVVTRNTDIDRVSTTHTNPKVSREEEIRREVKTGTAGAEIPIKGEANAVQTPSVIGAKNEKETEIRTDFFIDKKTEHVIDRAGGIEKISIGVLIPVEEKARAEAEKELPKLRAWVMKAAPESTEDLVSVEFISTKKPEPIIAAPIHETVYEWIAAHWPKIALFALAFIGLLVMARVIRGAMPKDTVEELQALTQAITEEMEASRGVSAGEPAAPGDIARVRQGLKEMIHKNPANVAASLKAYMTGR